MKTLLLPFLSGICLFPLSNNITSPGKANGIASYMITTAGDYPTINLQDIPSDGRMSVNVFKAQDFCRAELKDFEFNAHFIVLSADVYFTGAEFKTPGKGAIVSASLKPIKELMNRCKPGSIVTFDNVKVKGPDNKVRKIDGITLRLY